MLGAALGPPRTRPTQPPVCRAQAGWDLACLRALCGAEGAMAAPSIDPGVAWTEWAPVPAASAPGQQWTAANAGQAQLAADVATPAIVALGQTLFFDARLSRKGQVSCASCHAPERAFTDGRPLAVGEDGSWDGGAPRRCTPRPSRPGCSGTDAPPRSRNK